VRKRAKIGKIDRHKRKSFLANEEVEKRNRNGEKIYKRFLSMKMEQYLA